MKDRNIEICRFYFASYKLCLQKNNSHREARKYALDAVSMRYDISNYRARIIVAEYIREDSDKYLSAILEKNADLITLLKGIVELREKELEQIKLSISNSKNELLKSVAEKHISNLKEEIDSTSKVLGIINEVDIYERKRISNK